MACSMIRILAVVGCTALLAVAGSLLTASTAAAADDANACPALTQVKYPFITCAANEHGGVTLSIPGQPAPLACHLLLGNGACAASEKPWDIDVLEVGLGPAV